MSHASLLETLRSRTKVDCDTLDASVPQELGPFENCTSNQAIALAELSKSHNVEVLKFAALHADSARAKFPYIPLEALAVEIAIVLLALKILPHLRGRMHLQTNPFDAYDTTRTITCAERLVALARYLDSEVDVARLVIKVPSTWEGLQACRKLEEAGVKTLATTLFAPEQAIAAGQAGCHYVAPYLHDLRYVTRFPSFKEEESSDLAVDRCVLIQNFYRQRGYATQVLPAGLTTIDECMMLSGIQNMTISPSVLAKLAVASGSGQRSKIDEPDHTAIMADISQLSADRLIDNEGVFRIALTRSGRGLSESKQIFAINEFCEAQLALEKLIKQYIA